MSSTVGVYCRFGFTITWLDWRARNLAILNFLLALVLGGMRKLKCCFQKTEASRLPQNQREEAIGRISEGQISC
ncbi:hypothetical protein V6Z12_A11G080000 [Gossypium hirsutum]